jgi:16S rRNA C967 or C1407 C5-methylase (RsmB/RsmF family)/NOL1/NOP2/fmu family ribosome biogenesis protein
MRVPESLLKSLAGLPGFNRDAFLDVHESGEQVVSVRFNPAKDPGTTSLPLAAAIPWTQYGHYLSKRPSFTFDPLFHAGTYYVQEASSMFLEQALLQHADISQPLNVLDLCAAPGGKSTHLQSLLSSESLLVSNEVIKARASILVENITKWGSANVVVTNNDPQHFARLSGFFDVLVVDAPCSGSGLFRRDPAAIEEWSPANVQLCQGRQQRILADVWPALREDGLLIYSTCSYSPEEDEAILDWLCESFEVATLRMEAGNEGIVEIQSMKGAYGYRFYPDRVKGEGFFLAALRKKSEEDQPRLKVKIPDKLAAKEVAALKPWVMTEGMQFLKQGTQVYAFPEARVNDLAVLQGALYLQYAGTGIGEPIRDKLVPDHALALSPLLAPGIASVELVFDDAISFLQRKDFTVETKRGWQLVTFRKQPLGWINALPNRINNYYPREWRIRADGPAGV